MQMNFSFPSYAVIKLYKANQPVRLVVAFYVDTSFKLTNYLAQWFRSVIDYLYKPMYSSTFPLDQN